MSDGRTWGGMNDGRTWFCTACGEDRVVDVFPERCHCGKYRAEAELEQVREPEPGPAATAPEPASVPAEPPVVQRDPAVPRPLADTPVSIVQVIVTAEAAQALVFDLAATPGVVTVKVLRKYGLLA